ncbi:type II toxin-antitoxin system HipA family toxin [Thiofilum flexile]|uniref:type II toxin-antitoxin system HipA family toxin n=1 Tax=Thiofilum flexile TaxID=125627 RepID=UPI000365F771|nr:type II toxin-antitoxin system HipA family toxin [Thiofilum flexile]
MADIDVYLGHDEQPLFSGRLQKEAHEHVFSYQPHATEALSLTMPLRVASYHYSELHPIFQMNLPEGALRWALEQMTAKHYGSDDLSVLALLGRHQIGRLAYSVAGQPLPLSTEQPFTLNQLISSTDVDLFAQLLARYATYSGVAGVQPKVLMPLQQHLTLPLGHYIVKTWAKDYPHLACNEYVCLSIARAAGLEVPNFYLSDNAQLLITERFDLTPEGIALGFEDFCVLQGKGTKAKYDSSLEACTHTIRQFVSANQQAQALADFYKLTYLNIRVRNGDAHLKNNGVLYSALVDYHSGVLPNTERKLAPIFDIVSTVPYLPKDSMALLLGGSKRWPKRKVLHQFARQHCGLSLKMIEQIEAEVEGALASQLGLLESLASQHSNFAPWAERMRALLEIPLL